MKAYIVKYATTKGIVECDGMLSETDNNTLIVSDNAFTAYYRGNEFSFYRNIAEELASLIIKRKIKTLEWSTDLKTWHPCGKVVS